MISINSLLAGLGRFASDRILKQDEMMESRPFIGTPSSFREAYPDVKSVRFDGQERGDLASGFAERAVHYTESDLPGNIPCGNPRCVQGGYDLNATMMTLTENQDSSYEIDWFCNGHEGTPKGRRIGDPCMNSIVAKLTISYRTDSK